MAKTETPFEVKHWKLPLVQATPKTCEAFLPLVIIS